MCGSHKDVCRLEDTPGTARLAGFAISGGLIVGNSWFSHERSVIVRCQMSKTKQSSPDLPLLPGDQTKNDLKQVAQVRG